MKIKWYVFIGFLMLSIIACENANEKYIVGDWVAVKILESKEDMKLDPNEIQFSFDDKGFYSYKSTIGYEEQGIYSLEGDLLLSKDTLSTTAKEKAVRVLQLQPDSLTLEMLANGKEQIVYLVKK